MRTADPTQAFAAKLALGYEFVGREKSLDGYISGPLTPTLGMRFAFYASDLKGWVDNNVPQGLLLSPKYDRVPRNKELAARLTVKWDPSEKFDARFKFSVNSIRGTGAGANQQQFYCPRGVSQFATNFPGYLNDCKADDNILHGDISTGLSSATSRYGDGVPALTQQQMLGSLELNWHVNDNLTATSVTGYYNATLDNLENYNDTYNPALFLPSRNRYRGDEYSEEVRLASSYDGPLNFLVGGIYTKSAARTGSNTYRNGATAPANLTSIVPVQLNNYYLVQHGTAWSVFGQGMWKVIPTVEFDLGARYSHESKELPVVRATPASGAGSQAPNPPLITTPDTEASWNNLSPEATLTWRPTERFTLFGSYKYGFLSGGFNAGSSTFSTSLKYNQQNIRGAEIGTKTLLLNDHLRINISAYDYVVTGLQIAQSIGTIQTIFNAGKAKIKGVEFDANYRVPWVDGLSIRGSAAYNRARYSVYTVSCYGGQTPAQGCNLFPNATGAFTTQNLAGQQVLRAPDWVGSLGAGYERPIGGGLKLGLSSDASFSGKYFTDAGNKPFAAMPSYWIVDATVRISDERDRWELALVGKNLLNTYYWVRSLDGIFTGSGTGTAGGINADQQGPISRGRELMLRVTLKTGG